MASLRRSHRARALAILSIAVSLVVPVACSTSGSSAKATPTTVAVLPTIDLLAKPSVCTDEHQDLSIDQRVLSAPPVPAPWVDLYRATLARKGARLHGEFELGAAPIAAAAPEYIAFVGLPDRSGSFEIHVKRSDSGWFPELHAGTGLSDVHPVSGGNAQVTGSTVTFDVPVDAVPVIRIDQPISFGATAKLVDAKNRLLTKGGQVTTDPSSVAQVFDLCTPIR